MMIWKKWTKLESAYKYTYDRNVHQKSHGNRNGHHNKLNCEYNLHWYIGIHQEHSLLHISKMKDTFEFIDQIDSDLRKNSNKNNK